MQARRIALQIIQTTIVCAPDKLRDQLRNMTRMQLIRTLAASRPDITGYRQVAEAYRKSLRSLAGAISSCMTRSRILNIMCEAIVKDLAPELLARPAVGVNSAAQLLLTADDNPERLTS